MQTKHLWLSLLVFCFSFQLFSQQNQNLDSLLIHYRESNKKIDSLYKSAYKSNIDKFNVQALGALYNSLLYKAPTLSKQFAEKEVSVSKKINYTEGIGLGNYHIGAFYQNSGNIDSARFFFNKALGLYKGQGRQVGYANILSSLAFMNHLEGNDDESLEQYKEVLNIYKDSSNYYYAITLGNKANVAIDRGQYRIALKESLEALRILDTVYDKPWRKADVQHQIGRIEYLRGNYTKAIDYFKQALQVYKQQNDKVYESIALNAIGENFYHLKKYNEAQDYLNKSLTLAIDYNVSETEGDALGNLGKVSYALGKPEKALNYLERALQIHEANKYLLNTLYTKNEIAEVLIAVNQPKKAIAYLNEVIATASKEQRNNELLEAFNLRSKAHQYLGNLSKALKDKDQFIALNDSIFNKTKSHQIAELHTIYKTEKKEQQIALQQQEIVVLKQKAFINNLQRLLLVVGLVFLLIAFYAIRQKMKRNRLEKEKLDEALEFKNRELTTYALNIARKNETLEKLKSKVKALKVEENSGANYNQLISTINFDLQDDNNWKNFSRYFTEVHKDFNTNIKTKYPQITSNELRLLALLKMNLSSKEIASILNISLEGIKKARYRLRKKLDITTEESLQDLVISL